MKIFARCTLIFRAVIIITVFAIIFNIFSAVSENYAYALSIGETVEATAEINANENEIKITSDNLEYDNGLFKIAIGNVMIMFDKETVDKFVGQDVRLRLAELKDNIKAYNVKYAKIAYDIDLLGIELDDTKVKISIKISDTENNANELKVYHIDGEEKFDINATCKNGYVTFETNRFSVFVIAYDNSVKVPFEWLTNEIIVWIATAILFVTVIILFFSLRSQKGHVFDKASGRSVDNAPSDKTVHRKRQVTVAMRDADKIENNIEFNEDVRFVINNKGNYYGKIKAHINTFEGVRINETNNSAEVLFKKNKIVGLLFKGDGIYAEFNVTEKERKNLPVSVKESTSVLKIDDESAMTRTIAIINRNYYKLTSGRKA